MSILKSNQGNYEYFLEKCTQAYEKSDFQECLYAALSCFKLVVNSEELVKKKAAIRMIKFSAEKLLEEPQLSTKSSEKFLNEEMCSFCKKSEKKMKFINGVDVNICFECIETMCGVIQQNNS